MSRTCSQCGNNGHNSRTCVEATGAAAAASGGENGIMLFGVRVTEGSSFRKSVSMNNLSQYEQTESNADAGYVSDDVVHASGGSRERKRGVPWTEDEHKLFLLGLHKVGKGDWRGISRNFVKTRTPTQVASHAQKYFLRRNNHGRRRRRSSLFDITTTDTFMSSSMEEDGVYQETVPLSQPQPQPHFSCNIGGFPVKLPISGKKSKENLMIGPSNESITPSRLIRPIPVLPVPPSSKMADLNLNQKTPKEHLPLSLKLSTPSSDEQPRPAATHSSSFQPMSGSFNSNGDSIISVA